MSLCFPRLLALCLTLVAISMAGCSKPQDAPKKTEPQPLKAAAPGWTVIGPGGGGSMYEPTISPHDPEHAFVRCDMTGAYVTFNGGRKWTLFNLRTVVQDFEFDPLDPNTVYAANNALYRSEDMGRTWNIIYPDPMEITGESMSGDHAGQRFETSGREFGGSIDRVRVDPSDNQRIYMGFSSGRDAVGCRIVFSADRGVSWEELGQVQGSQVHQIFPGVWSGNPAQVTVITDRACVRLGVPGGQADILPLPAEGDIIAAGGGSTPHGEVLFYILTATKAENGRINGGMYRSADGGMNWEPTNILMDSLPEGEEPPAFSALAVCEGSPETVYLSCGSYPVMMQGSPQRQSGILKTDNGGRDWSWKLVVCGGSILSRNFSGGWLLKWLGWFRNPSYLGVCPTDPEIVYGTDSGRTIKSIDGGGHWQQLISNDLPDGATASRGLDVTTTYGMHFDPFDPRHIFITYTDIGLFHSWDGGRSWMHSITGIPRQWRNTCYWLEFDPAVRGRIWSVWSNVHDIPRPKMHRDGNLVNGNAQGGVAVSDDGGRWWELCNVGVMENGAYVKGLPLNAVCTHITLDTNSPVQSRTLYVCEYGRGVYKSTDGGKTWDLKVKGLGENRKAWRTTLLPDGRLILLVARGGLEGRNYEDGAIYESTDGAGTWKKMVMPDGANAPNDLVFDPTDPSRMYLSCWPHGEPDGEKGGGLWLTEDSGKTWEQVLDEKLHVYAAAVDPRNPTTVYANTFNSAAFRSDDRGKSWRRLEGYSFKWGHRPVPDPRNADKLYLTTFGGSVYYGPSNGVPGAKDDIVNLPEDKMYIRSVLD